MRPFPSDSTTPTVPVSATAKFAPEIATRARAGTPRAGAARRREQRLAGRREAGLVERLAQELRDLAPAAVERRDEQVRGPLAGELDDPLGQVGLDRLDPASSRARR